MPLSVNGHVADKINHLTFKYLIVSCHCDNVKAMASAGSAPLLPAAVIGQPRLRAPAKRSAHFNTIDRTEMSSLQKTKRNITVLSKVTERPVTLCVISSRKVDNNFISQKTVDRLGLRVRFDAAIICGSFGPDAR
ncbi:hypothetical protein ACET3X_001462 [Alternaria dauci]|uniref:Uncharacterized protein n=1 Tax=Alternaria dauci TaxID=48095 RepID=A0ABR3UXD3_9PLEO